MLFLENLAITSLLFYYQGSPVTVSFEVDSIPLEHHLVSPLYYVYSTGTSNYPVDVYVDM